MLDVHVPEIPVMSAGSFFVDQRSVHFFHAGFGFPMNRLPHSCRLYRQMQCQARRTCWLFSINTLFIVRADVFFQLVNIAVFAAESKYGCKRDNNTTMYKKMGPDTGYDCINNYAPSSETADFLNECGSSLFAFIGSSLRIPYVSDYLEISAGIHRHLCYKYDPVRSESIRYRLPLQH